MGEVIRTYYESGELKSEVFAINDKKNGEYKSYYESGHQRVSPCAPCGAPAVTIIYKLYIY